MNEFEYSLFAMDTYLRPDVTTGDFPTPMGAAILETRDIDGMTATAYQVGTEIVIARVMRRCGCSNWEFKTSISSGDSTMTTLLEYALLSMDAYSRGYTVKPSGDPGAGARAEDPETDVGPAEIIWSSRELKDGRTCPLTCALGER